jgi:glycosyltransferase involved in cell wall biosynthesis
VLVGPVQGDLSAIRRPNVHILGRRPYGDLPAYVQAFDVGLIPYVLDEHTVAVDPLKLLEYLAAGVPVVSTDLPEVRKYSDAILIGAQHASFVAATARALSDPFDTADSRREVARRHGWERRAEVLRRILGSILPRSAAGVR